MSTQETILAWHWAKNDLRTQHTDEAIVLGEPLKATGKLVLCENGMHASLCPFDALQYAPGSKLCRVELLGEVIKGEDKLCAQSRKVVEIYDADHLLHEFACLCAERALKQAKVDDKRSWRAIEVKRLWMAGKATDAELAAASDAASDAAGAAASDAEWAATRAATWAAARDSELAAASDAAGAAAWAATWAAARDSEWAAASDAAGAAAWAAARDAAGAAECKWQRDTFNGLIDELVTKHATA